LFTHDPRVSGCGYGFIFNRINEQDAVGHGGDTFYFHSMLLLLPKHNTGLFVSYNSDRGGTAREELIKALFDRYFPVSPIIEPWILAGYENRQPGIIGEYRSNRRAHTTIDKVGELMSTLEVLPGDKAGFIQTRQGSEKEHWFEIQPYVFQKTDSLEKLVFKVDDTGGRTLGFLENVPILALERMRWYETARFHLLLLLICVVILLTSLILPFVTLVINRRSDSLLARRLPTHTKSRVLAAIVSALLLSFIVGLMIILRDPMEIVYGVPPYLGALLTLPILAGILTTVLLVVTASAWRNVYWGLAGRIHYTLVFLAAVATLWQLNYWNFVGWHFY